MSWPGCVHVLQAGEEIENFVDRATKSGALRVVPHLMDDASLRRTILMRDGIPARPCHHRMIVLTVGAATTIAGVDIQHLLESCCMLGCGAVANGHVVWLRWRGRRIGSRGLRLGGLVGRCLALAGKIVLAHDVVLFCTDSMVVMM